MPKTLLGYVESGTKAFEVEGKTLKVQDKDILRFTAFQMQLASGELIPVNITFNEKERKAEEKLPHVHGPAGFKGALD